MIDPCVFHLHPLQAGGLGNLKVAAKGIHHFKLRRERGSHVGIFGAAIEQAEKMIAAGGGGRRELFKAASTSGRTAIRSVSQPTSSMVPTTEAPYAAASALVAGQWAPVLPRPRELPRLFVGGVLLGCGVDADGTITFFDARTGKTIEPMGSWGNMLGRSR